jgi:hypothetical protein
MPSCVLDIGLNAPAQDVAGLPTGIEAYARVQGLCSRVRFTLRPSQNGPVLFSAEATPDSNGTCTVTFPLQPLVFPCGSRFWVEAQCVSGGTCSKAAFLGLACKQPPGGNGGGVGGGGHGGGGGNGGGGGGGGGGGFQFPSFCSVMARAFLVVLYLGLIVLVVSVALAIPAGLAVAAALILGAMALQAIWLTWCTTSFCHYWGAILWVLKNVVVVGAIVSALSLSVAGMMITLAIGAAAGIITAQLRYRRCPLPTLTTSMQQLPLN